MSVADFKPPLSERAAIHGRNVMAISCLVLALAWIPGINLKDLELFGLTFKGDVTAQTSAWAIMATVLSYYCWRFRLDYTADYEGWSARTGPKGRKKRVKKNNYTTYSKTTEAEDRFITRLDQDFWRYDVWLPLGLFSAAAITITYKISQLHDFPQRLFSA